MQASTVGTRRGIAFGGTTFDKLWVSIDGQLPIVIGDGGGVGHLDISAKCATGPEKGLVFGAFH